MSIVGVTIDYGPFGFMEYFDADHICNSSGTFCKKRDNNVNKMKLHHTVFLLKLLSTSKHQNNVYQIISIKPWLNHLKLSLKFSFPFLDNNGRYSYKKQPEICKWNLWKLGEAIRELFDSPDQAKEVLNEM